jgi:hypothetical protein
MRFSNAEWQVEASLRLTAAHDKIRNKVQRIHSSNWQDDSVVSVKMTMGELKALEMLCRNFAGG